MEFEGKVAFVTGAGSGIGRATAMKLAERGARLALVGRSQHKVEGCAEEVRATGAEALAISADVADDDAMGRSVAAIVGRWGRLDHVVACAGVNGAWAPIDALRPEEWDKTIRTNLRGAFMTFHHAAPAIRRSGRGGAIVIVSSYRRA
jgi:NAD(P)-dependent dehydrogenase (short-subunit alcohol dehydrogenase family)